MAACRIIHGVFWESGDRDVGSRYIKPVRILIECSRSFYNTTVSFINSLFIFGF